LFFKAEQKILDLAEKYKELKKSGKVEKFLAKKRKKQLGKDSKHLNRNEHVRFV
jgi:ribosomal RNA-processing protein 36